MIPFRDIKRKARRDLHNHMGVPALYIESKGAEPRPITVRLHTRFDALGDQKGTNFHSAEREEVIPRIIIMRDEVPSPKRNAIVSIEPGEAYYLDAVQPPDDITITIHVVPLTAKEAEDLPVPELNSQ